MSKNKSLLNPRQYAYRPNSSCENEIINITEDMDNGEIALFGLVDLCKELEKK